MVARIAENIPNQYVSVQHYGILEECRGSWLMARVDFKEDQGKFKLNNYQNL